MTPALAAIVLFEKLRRTNAPTILQIVQMEQATNPALAGTSIIVFWGVAVSPM